MPFELECTNDRRVDRGAMRQRGQAKSRRQLRGTRAPADPVGSLEYERLQPRFGKKGGRDQAVVSAADDNRVTH
jgi:hypothetical protein